MARKDVHDPAPQADVDAWLCDLAGRLPRHHEVLVHLTKGVRDDPRVVQLSVGCSIGRGTADELSDLDCEISLEPNAWPLGLELVEPLVRSAGDVVDVLHHRWSESGTGQHRRTAVLYENGIQLDLMVWPVSVWSGMHPPGTVVLYATRDVFTRPWDVTRAAPTPEQLHEWFFLGWWALLDADKYLRRGSPWEARQQLELARDAIWRLAAATQKLPFAEYGITTLLDAPEPRLPSEAIATAADLDPTRLRAAVERCAELLGAQWASAVEANPGAAPGTSSRLVMWARDRLRLQRMP